MLTFFVLYCDVNKTRLPQCHGLSKTLTDEYDSTEYNMFVNMIKKEAEYASGWAYIVTKNSLLYEPHPLVFSSFMYSIKKILAFHANKIVKSLAFPCNCLCIWQWMQTHLLKTLKF